MHESKGPSFNFTPSPINIKIYCISLYQDSVSLSHII